jgi:hypothetical protein
LSLAVPHDWFISLGEGLTLRCRRSDSRSLLFVGVVFRSGHHAHDGPNLLARGTALLSALLAWLCPFGHRVLVSSGADAAAACCFLRRHRFVLPLLVCRQLQQRSLAARVWACSSPFKVLVFAAMHIVTSNFCCCGFAIPNVGSSAKVCVVLLHSIHRAAVLRELLQNNLIPSTFLPPSLSAGTGFGASLARVFVGGAECTGVVQVCFGWIGCTLFRFDVLFVIFPDSLSGVFACPASVSV